ncbi:MAG: hypothetical protein RIR90_669 [Bacteroidota bacterium]|jgi:hypothetical protein
MACGNTTTRAKNADSFTKAGISINELAIRSYP